MKQSNKPIPNTEQHLSLADGIRRFEDERKKAGRLLVKKEELKTKEYLAKNPKASTKYMNVNFSNPVERAKFDYGL
jgi:hypothetical protein